MSSLCLVSIRLQLHGAIYRPDSFVLMQLYCANLKAIRYESTSLNRIVADKSHSVIAALDRNPIVKSHDQQVLAYCKCISHNLRHQSDPGSFRLMREESVAISSH